MLSALARSQQYHCCQCNRTDYSAVLLLPSSSRLCERDVVCNRFLDQSSSPGAFPLQQVVLTLLGPADVLTTRLMPGHGGAQIAALVAFSFALYSIIAWLFVSLPL